MYNKPIFLQPVFQDRIWGSNKLKTLYDDASPNDQAGEAWTISDHKYGPSKISHGSLKVQILRQTWTEHLELFGKSEAEDELPLLVKILDANHNLSVQVHPDDENAEQ